LPAALGSRLGFLSLLCGVLVRLHINRRRAEDVFGFVAHLPPARPSPQWAKWLTAHNPLSGVLMAERVVCSIFANRWSETGHSADPARSQALTTMVRVR
jgi:hypothetical protein